MRNDMLEDSEETNKAIRENTRQGEYVVFNWVAEFLYEKYF